MTKEAIELCVKNDRRSQELLYQKFYGKMLAVCMRYDKDHDGAMDLVQEGFLKLFTSLHKYEFNGSFDGWVQKIFVNNAIDNYRKKKNVYVVPEEDYRLAQLSTEFDEIGYNEEPPERCITKDEVISAMQKLSPGYRAVFNLYVIENYIHKDIAKKLGISVGASKSNLMKARKNIKTLLKRWNYQ